jgi:ADP-heptose:LPS heptosyltransferase
MARWRSSIRALLYVAGHAAWRGLRSPRWAWQACQRAATIVRTDGFRELRRVALDDYLPRHYRLRTKIRIREPSGSVYRRFAGAISLPSSDPAQAHQIPQGMINAWPRILVIRRAAMGDVLMATPVVRKLYQERGGCCRIDVATDHPEVFRNNPYVARTIATHELEDLQPPVDIIVNLDGVYERNPAIHPTQAFAFHALGRIDDDLGIDLFPTDDEAARIGRVVSDLAGSYVVVHKAPRRSPQRYLPPALWERVVAGLLSREELRIVQVGTSDDEVLAGHPRLLDHRGGYSIQELYLLIESSRLFLGGDSGPAHIAAASRAPMAVFYTGAHHQWRRPLRPAGAFLPLTPAIDCYGCQAQHPIPGAHTYCARGDYACVDRFDADDIVRRVFALLDETQ